MSNRLVFNVALAISARPPPLLSGLLLGFCIHPYSWWMSSPILDHHHFLIIMSLCLVLNQFHYSVESQVLYFPCV